MKSGATIGGTRASEVHMQEHLQPVMRLIHGPRPGQRQSHGVPEQRAPLLLGFDGPPRRDDA